MARALRNHVIVAQDHSITVCAPELKPGARVEVIVLLEAEREQVVAGGPSFVDAISDVEIEAPTEYSTNFEDALYPGRLDS